MKCTFLFQLILLLFAVACTANTSDIYSHSRLIQLGETKQQWMEETEIRQLIRDKIRFRDITDFGAPSSSAIQQAKTYVFPSALAHQQQVNQVIPKISQTIPKTILTNLTAFTNRYYNNDNGRKSSEWLAKVIQDINPGINLTMFTHRFPQKSIIARIEGTEKPEELLVVSAHQDSINIDNPDSGRAPGADDDGSGSVTILETLRVFFGSGLRPKRSIEFHWYAGEEGGLLGSADVTKSYADKTVIADLHFDMTGYPMDPPAVGLVTDYTDADMNGFLKLVVKAYTDLPTKEFKCGYACSDHASWHERGVRSALPFENQYVDGNQNIHTTMDTIGTVDISHLVKFVKIALGFIIEVSEAT